MTRCVQSYLNRYKSSWRTRQEVNSSIIELDTKIKNLFKSRNKELKNSTSYKDKVSVRNRYDNDIKFYDHLLYCI